MPRANATPFHIPVRSYRRQLLSLVRQALDEDVGAGDLTAQAMDLGTRTGESVLIAKSPGVLAGVEAFELTFRRLDHRFRCDWSVREGTHFRKGRTIARMRGHATALLTGERTAINFLAHLSGIATATRHFVDLIPKGRTRLLDTRKTTPGWRYLEKRATLIGGAANHRLGLYDALMLKDTHIGAAGSSQAAVRLALDAAGKRILICEIHDPAEIGSTLALGARWLLLDNLSPKQLRPIVAKIRQFEGQTGSRVIVEASGGVTARTIAAIARCGVDYISVGSITHSAPAVDFSMKWSR